VSDFTTASQTAFQNPDVQFININVAEFDAIKRNALPLVGDALVTLEALSDALDGDRILKSYRTADAYQAQAAQYNQEWDTIVAG